MLPDEMRGNGPKFTQKKTVLKIHIRIDSGGMCWRLGINRKQRDWEMTFFQGRHSSLVTEHCFPKDRKQQDSPGVEVNPESPSSQGLPPPTCILITYERAWSLWLAHPTPGERCSLPSAFVTPSTRTSGVTHIKHVLRKEGLEDSGLRSESAATPGPAGLMGGRGVRGRRNTAQAGRREGYRQGGS